MEVAEQVKLAGEVQRLASETGEWAPAAETFGVLAERAASPEDQAQLYATDVGKLENGMNKPQVGIASVWYEGNPCNMHLLAVAEEVKASVQASGMVGLRFNSIGVSDGISNGTDGMA